MGVYAMLANILRTINSIDALLLSINRFRGILDGMGRESLLVSRKHLLSSLEGWRNRLSVQHADVHSAIKDLIAEIDAELDNATKAYTQAKSNSRHNGTDSPSV